MSNHIRDYHKEDPHRGVVNQNIEITVERIDELKLLVLNDPHFEKRVREIAYDEIAPLFQNLPSRSIIIQ